MNGRCVMMMRRGWVGGLVIGLMGCGSPRVEMGSFLVESFGDHLRIGHSTSGTLLDEVWLQSGSGGAEVEMQFGSFLFDPVVERLRLGVRYGRLFEVDDGWSVTVRDDAGETLGTLLITRIDNQMLRLSWQPEDATDNRMQLSAGCANGDAFMGLGSHAFDIEHRGERFGLWVSEPGIGKSEADAYPPDWFLTGTRHATSFPVPFLLRPNVPHGLLAEGSARVEVDLCATDSERFSMTGWDGAMSWVVVAGAAPLQVIEHLSALTGRLQMPPAWVFAPWTDAIRGPDRVRDTVAALRAAGAPGSVIWTEDWKGGTDTGTGYRLGPEWFVDDTLYGDAAVLAAELEDQGYKWFAYFAPFLKPGTATWDDALANDVVVRDADGAPYLFTGVDFLPRGLVDVSTEVGRTWVQGYTQAALDLGFDGWMADYAEWLPTDAVLASGEAALEMHNAYPLWWQQTHAEAIAGHDASFFVRSGWTGTAGIAPVVWGGDQRTSFDGDDGFPTVLPLGLGLSASGLPLFTHDIAGYQSVGNPPSDKELWMRWAALGAYSPIMRTHHGSFDRDNWQFDSDAETLSVWAVLAREHMRLLPYRMGLAAQAAEVGTPMILPTSLVYGGEAWGRMDVWLLGRGMLVAPVLEAGATGRQVALPGGANWYSWATRQPAASGWWDAGWGDIPVFVAAGTTVPTFDTIPDTMVGGANAGLIGPDDADASRTVYLFGGGSSFTEADGTHYLPRGQVDAGAEQTVTLTSGTVDLGTLSVDIDGPRERTYRMIVIP